MREEGEEGEDVGLRKERVQRLLIERVTMKWLVGEGFAGAGRVVEVGSVGLESGDQSFHSLQRARRKDGKVSFVRREEGAAWRELELNEGKSRKSILTLQSVGFLLASMLVLTDPRRAAAANSSRGFDIREGEGRRWGAEWQSREGLV